MIKKLIIAAAFSGSMLIGVPVANASPLECMQQYEANMAHCSYVGQGGYSTPCSQYAAAVFQDCLQRDVVEHS